MPNLLSHFNLGLQTLSSLGDPSMEAHLGSFLLGCTTPDIRAITKWKRDTTHFAPLSINKVGVGTEGLFHANSHLANESRLSGATRAFLAGYISHLTVDEAWIIYIYQPYFANRGLFPDPIEANVSDRALQLDLDKAAGDEIANMDNITETLQSSDQDVDVGFIDSETLSQWRAWVSDFSQRQFSWDRLHFLMRRMYRENEEVQMVVESFLSSLPASLERVYERVPRDGIRAFQKMTLRKSVQLIKEYLDVP